MKRLIRSLTVLAVLLMTLPSPCQAQRGKKGKAKAAALEAVVFNAENPFAKENSITEGTPWEKAAYAPVELPEGVTATIPDPLPDLEKLSMEEYNSAVSLAFESLRIIYGEMSEEDAKKFMEMWAPLFDNPTQEIIDYLNKLNPLLSQFIVARESYLNSVSNVQLLTLDASEAVGWEDEDAFKAAMFQIRLYAVTIEQLEAAMLKLADRINALGNPPDPLAARAAARRLYNSAFRTKQIYLGETWMGTRIDEKHTVPGLPALTEPMFRYLLKVQVNGEDRYFVLELKEDGIAEPSEKDPYGVGNVHVEQMYFSDKGELMPDFKSDGRFQTYYPKPPAVAITMMTMTLMGQFESSYVSDEDKKDPQLAEAKEEYHEYAGHYGNRILRSGVFFKTALMWAYQDKWNSYEFQDTGVVPYDALRDFEEAFKQQIVEEEKNRKNLPKLKMKRNKSEEAAEDGEYADAGSENTAMDAPMDVNAARRQQIKDSLAFEEASKQESIKFHEENIKAIERNIKSDERSLADARSRYAKASPDRRASIQSEIEEYERRIRGARSDIQSERDNINGLKTGHFVHTRTECDNYNLNRLIQDSKQEAIRYNMTKRAASIMEKQVDLLPEEDQDAARDRLEKLLYEDGALALGDYEKVRKLAGAYNNQIVGYSLKEQAEAQDEVAWADLKEAGANAVIMACGSVTVGLAGEALAGAYGAGAATTIWGTRAVGAVYGGVTGYIAGGPGKGVSSAAGYFHPVTGAIASFVEGYTAEGNEKKGTWEKVWEGTKQMGQDYLIGKAFEFSANGIAKTASAFLPDGIVNFNLTGNFSSRQKLDMLKTNRDRLEAEDVVKAFSKRNNEYITMLADGKTPQAKLDATRKEINQMAAAMNMDYHAKWYMKYKAEPNLRAHFDQAVQRNYREMIPEMEVSLKQQGYDLSDIEFKQFRNSSSSGSSSMDLDLAPVSKSTGKEPLFMKNGEPVTPAAFMKDAQKTMNTVYHKQTGLSAPASEMNLTTSAHPEAYSNPELLKKDVNWDNVSAKDRASIGDVLQVKTDAIDKNIRMTETTKLQAKCRESTKEIENMLIPMLKSDLKRASNAKQASAIAERIEYWQHMDETLSKIGKQNSDPMEILKLNNEIKRATGGKDAVRVVNDLIHEFKPSMPLEELFK